MYLSEYVLNPRVLQVGNVNRLLKREVPQPAVRGCYVPVVVAHGAMLSNLTSIPIVDAGGPCSEPLGISYLNEVDTEKLFVSAITGFL